MVTVLQPCGGGVVTVLQPCGGGMVTVLQPCGGGMVIVPQITWSLYADNAVISRPLLEAANA
ncbi:MAG: hypothetical protein K0U36_04205 [Alphaproteobacteria bacterium]|nr:hypothetical protein [Alphaproteobacteria bacterium]